MKLNTPADWNSYLPQIQNHKKSKHLRVSHNECGTSHRSEWGLGRDVGFQQRSMQRDMCQIRHERFGW